MFNNKFYMCGKLNIGKGFLKKNKKCSRKKNTRKKA